LVRRLSLRGGSIHEASIERGSDRSIVGTTFSGTCHGTLGELFQGPFVHDGELHIAIISLPIRRYSWAHFTIDADGDLERDLRTKPKSRKAIEVYLSRDRRRLPRGRWTYDSELLEGKGMASSTADIVASIRCLDAVFGARSAPETITAILREIERSDSVFLEGHALYLSSRQEIVRGFHTNPRFHVCYIDEGGAIDTEAVGPALLTHYERRLLDYGASLERAIDAFARQDLAAIAHSATQSAVLGQSIVPKRHLDVMLSRQRQFLADGIVVAHSGTLIGYLFVRKLTALELGELASFFHSLGHQCRFIETGL
jgi:uncharacterized protein involved in propanediol utilization